jgi:hypothetical protein
LEASVCLSYITSNIWNKCLFQFVHINTLCAVLSGRDDAPCTFLTALDLAGLRLLASRSSHLYYPIRAGRAVSRYVIQRLFSHSLNAWESYQFRLPAAVIMFLHTCSLGNRYEIWNTMSAS